MLASSGFLSPNEFSYIELFNYDCKMRVRTVYFRADFTNYLNYT